MKRNSLIIFGLLLLWFTFDITGLKIGNNIIVVSAITDEPIDILWWVIFVILLALFIIKNNIGKYLLLVFLLAWAVIQYPKWFTVDISKIEGYNSFFEHTHHLIKISDKRIIKDTYHIILDLLILIGNINIILYLLLNKRRNKNSHNFA